MGRHYCQLCCCSHPLTDISNSKSALQIELFNHVSLSVCQFSDLEPSNSETIDAHELNCNSSDFSSTFITSKVILDADCYRSEGFWSYVLSGQIEGKAVVVKLYKPQKTYSQRQVFDKFHRVNIPHGALHCTGRKT